MIQSNSMYIPAVEREAFASLRVAANPSETYYFTAFDFVPEHAIELQEGETIDVHYDTFVEVDGVNACIIYQGKKYPRGFREGLQPSLTPTQMAAVNSGITAQKLEEYNAVKDTMETCTIGTHLMPIVADTPSDFVEVVSAEGVNVGDPRIFYGLTSKAFRLLCDVDLEIVIPNTSVTAGYYDFYFAYKHDNTWSLTKKFTSNVSSGASLAPLSPEDEEENENNNEQQQEVNSAETFLNKTVTDNDTKGRYNGYPQIAVVAVRKDRTALTSTDITNLTNEVVSIKITAKRTQDLDVMLAQFDAAKPWETLRFNTQSTLSDMFEVFPTFEPGDDYSEDDYPAGFDHYLCVKIKECHGNAIISCLPFSRNVFLRIEIDGKSKYNQDILFPMNLSDSDELVGENENGDYYKYEIVCDNNISLTFLNEPPSIPDSSTRHATLVSIQNGMAIYGDVDLYGYTRGKESDIIDWNGMVDDTVEATLIADNGDNGGGSASTPTTGGDPDD